MKSYYDLENTPKGRLLLFLQVGLHGMGQNKFAKECGLSSGCIARWQKDIPPKALYKILEKYPSLSRSWLLTGEGSMLKDAQDTPPVSVGNVGGSVVGAVGVGNRVEVPPAVPSGDVGRLVDLLACQISKKDEQIDRKDEQIARLLSVLENLGGGAK